MFMDLGVISSPRLLLPHSAVAACRHVQVLIAGFTELVILSLEIGDSFNALSKGAPGPA
jgi:hypothetical protein